MIDALVESKFCSKCGETKAIDQFNRNNYLKDGHKYYCRACEKVLNNTRRSNRIQQGICPVRNVNSLDGSTRCAKCTEYRKSYRRQHYRKDPRPQLLKEAQRRAKTHGLNFNITLDDIPLPERCPVLGIRLEVGAENLDNSPSIDRFIPELGYVKGNVTLISHRANRIKSNATIKELKQIVRWMEKNYDH